MQVDADGNVVVTASVSTAGQELTIELHLPAGPTRPGALLPLYRGISAHLVGEAVAGEAGQGRAVSCRKGCGACCSQLVPLAELEAWRLGEVIAELPEPRRATILGRFAAARARLEASGLLPQVRDPATRPKPEVVPFGKQYLALGIPCPFLEDGACSIYEERPIICREYLVTSPPASCAQPDEGPIRTVPVAGNMTATLRWLTAAPGADRTPWVPLVLLPEWLAAHPEPPPARTGVELAETLFRRLDTGTPEAPVPAP